MPTLLNYYHAFPLEAITCYSPLVHLSRTAEERKLFKVQHWKKYSLCQG